MGKAENGKPILIGWASTSIVPEKPVQLRGQVYERVSEYVHDPVTATALALESVDDLGSGEQAVLVSCDQAVILKKEQGRLRESVALRLPDLEVNKLFLAATHTHSAPNTVENVYPSPGPGVMTAEEYVEFFLERLTEVVVEAWGNRKAGGISWGLGHAAVGYNRRVVYADGTARMYGKTDAEHFLNVEGGHDHGVEMLFCWDEEGRHTGVVLNVACPSQVVESKLFVSADFWSSARKRLRSRYSEDLYVLPLTGAAGDQSPRDLVRRGRGEPDMHGEAGLEELGKRIADAVDYVSPLAEERIRKNLVFKHVARNLTLPARKVTRAEADAAKVEYEALMAKQPAEDSWDGGRMRRLKHRVLKRYEQQGEEPVFGMELHVIRLGEIVIVTNPFELFLDYGMRIKARSQALQTFVVQLACDHGGYLPTARALSGGHYGAEVSNVRVTPEGGQVLVDRTVEVINSLWQGE